MSDRIGDAAIEKRYRAQMEAIARTLDEFLNDGTKGKDRQTGFVLLVFPFNSQDGRCNYISNGADRRDIVTMMKEQIARFEGQPEMKGRA